MQVPSGGERFTFQNPTPPETPNDIQTTPPSHNNLLALEITPPDFSYPHHPYHVIQRDLIPEEDDSNADSDADSETNSDVEDYDHQSIQIIQNTSIDIPIEHDDHHISFSDTSEDSENEQQHYPPLVTQKSDNDDDNNDNDDYVKDDNDDKITEDRNDDSSDSDNDGNDLIAQGSTRHATPVLVQRTTYRRTMIRHIDSLSDLSVRSLSPTSLAALTASTLILRPTTTKRRRNKFGTLHKHSVDSTSSSPHIWEDQSCSNTNSISTSDYEDEELYADAEADDDEDEDDDLFDSDSSSLDHVTTSFSHIFLAGRAAHEKHLHSTYLSRQRRWRRGGNRKRRFYDAVCGPGKDETRHADIVPLDDDGNEMHDDTVERTWWYFPRRRATQPASRTLRHREQQLRTGLGVRRERQPSLTVQTATAPTAADAAFLRDKGDTGPLARERERGMTREEDDDDDDDAANTKGEGRRLRRRTDEYVSRPRMSAIFGAEEMKRVVEDERVVLGEEESSDAEEVMPPQWMWRRSRTEMRMDDSDDDSDDDSGDDDDDDDDDDDNLPREGNKSHHNDNDNDDDEDEDEEL